MANQKIVLAQLDIDINSLVAAAKQSKEAIEAINKELKKLNELGQGSSAQFEKMQQDVMALTNQLQAQNDALDAQVKHNFNLANAHAEVLQALNDTSTAQRELGDSMAGTDAATTGYAENAAGTADAINTLNESLRENRNLMADGASTTENQAKTFNDYKDQVAQSFASINVFNGGLGGFITRAQEAGGTGPLLKNAFAGITGGIKGMGAAVMANPVGAIIAAIVIVAQALYDVFKDFKPLMDKVEQGMAAVGAVVNVLKNSFLALFDPSKSITDIFSDFGPAAAKAAEGAMKLKKAQQELSDQMELQEVRSKRAAVLINEQIALSENAALSEQDRIAAFKKASQIENEDYAQRKKITQAKYDAALKEIAISTNLTDAEIANLNRSGFAYAQKLQQTKSIDKALLETLKNVQNEREDVFAEEAGLVSKHNQGLGQMHAAFNKKREDDQAAANAKALAKQKEYLDNQKKLLTDAAEKQRLLLDNFISSQGEKAQSLDEEIKQAEAIYAQKMKIAEAEFKASDRKSNDSIKRQTDENQASKELMASRAAATAAHAKAEYDLWMAQHQTLIKGNTVVTDAIIEEERKRLDAVKKRQLEELAAEKKTSEEIIDRKQKANQQLTIDENAYLQEKISIDAQYQTNKENLDKMAGDKKVTDEQTRLEVIAATATTQYDQDVANEQIRHDAEIAKLDERKANGLLTEEQYNTLLEIEKTKHTGILKDLDMAVIDNKLNIAQSGLTAMAGILGKESAAGKAVAVAQATIDTFKSAVSAYAAGMEIGGPAGLVIGPLSAAAAVSAGMANVKKITSTKTPKAEKGALFNIGGNRHSNGGTLFTGADGTQFEAEQGELIGVMNRNAAAHFMAFNNAFPAGGSSTPNYFAGGGIVSRDIAQPSLNIDELASKIAVANRAIPAPVVAVQDIIAQGNSYVQVRDAANF